MIWTTIKDGRGNTYVSPLDTPIRVGAYEPDPATHVCRWYNRDERSWVVSYSDANGTQVGPSDYVWSAEEALSVAQSMFNGTWF